MEENLPLYQVDPTFNLQRTFGERSVAGQNEKVVIALEVETSLPLILTQDPQKTGQPNYLYVPESAHIRVLGDEITISGKLSFPGRNVVIFARTLLAESDGTNPPTISVDGAPLPEDIAKPKPLEQGAEGKKAKGENGGGGVSERAEPIGFAWEARSPGQPGWSGPDHPNEMNGEPGGSGHIGNPSGTIWICCNKTDFGGPNQTLTLTAVGGLGGEGQPGQKGADGGDGGNGADWRGTGLSNYFPPTAGGGGGKGGKGGKGGQGGQGGNGGTITVHCITVHCISAQPALTVSCKGGAGGAPGAPGEGGDPGQPGKGGKGTFGGRHYPSVPKAPNGQPGSQGDRGDIGEQAPPSLEGASSITTDKVDLQASKLDKFVRVSQLQMLLERVRAEYLVTEPANYAVRLMAVASAQNLVNTGRNLVVVGLVGQNLHIRIFDATGKQVVDKSESELVGGETIAALKKRFEMTVGDILQAGGWRSADQLKNMSAADQRQALVDQLTQISNQPASYYSQLSDYQLIGDGAVLAFLLKQGVRDEGSLKTYSDDDKRNTLINGIWQHTAKTEIDLQAMDNQQLVRLVLEQHPGNSFVLQDSLLSLWKRLSKMSGKDQQQILDNVKNVKAVVGYSDPWDKIGQQLFWLTSLLEATAAAANEDPNTLLARTLFTSVWPIINNYQNGLDYYGKTPKFVPTISLDTYRKAFHDSLGSPETGGLAAIEKDKDAYFNALKVQTDRTNDLKAALTSVGKHLDLLNARKDEISTDLKNTEGKINEFETKRKTDEPKLKADLDGFKEKVKSAFGLSLDTFFNCLSQLSFMHIPAPANKTDHAANEPVANATTTLGTVTGYASAGAMGISQAGAMIKEAIDNVVNDSGELINKKLVLDQIEVIESDVDLKSEFEKLEGGFFSHEGSSRVLVELNKFRDLYKDFRNVSGSALTSTLRTDLDSYIDLITSRNRYIDHYNIMLRQLLELASEVKKLNLQKTSVEGNLSLEAAQPGLPAMATFVSGLYEQAKAICLSDLYLTYRAYAYWALEPYSGFYDLIGRSPGAITSVQLKAAEQKMQDRILNKLSTNRDTPNIFPAKEESESSMGQVVVLTKATHPDFFADLVNFGNADFELEPATNASTAPASSFVPTTAAWYSGATRPNFAPSDPHPFHGKADVRITKVRTWMIGMVTSNGYHNLILVNLGQEQFRTREDEPYPARTQPASEPDKDKRDPEYIMRNLISIPFIYKSEGLSYDSDKKVFTPGKLFGAGEGTEDGNLDFPLEGGAALPDQSKYAVIGPFGKWRLIVRSEDNPGLDLSQLSMIVIDFHGFHRMFNS